MSVAILRYEAPPRTAPGPPGGLQRGHGVAEIVFARRGQASVLERLYQQTPCRVLFPRPETGDLPLGVLLTTSGGLAGGDRIEIAATAQAGAAASLTSQAAEKIYRSLGAESDVHVALAVAEGALLEWLPQETILFDGARLRRLTEAKVAASGRLLAAEMLVFGRVARGEGLRRGLLHDAWRITREGRLVWADGLRLDGAIAEGLARPFGLGGAEALATALYVAPDAAGLVDAARRIAGAGRTQGAASLVGGVLLARFLGAPAAAVRGDLARYLAALRHAATGLPARLPRVWHV